MGNSNMADIDQSGTTLDTRRLHGAATAGSMQVVDDPEHRRKKRRARLRLYAARVTVGVLLFSIWEGVSTYFVDPFWLSMPSRISGRLLEWLVSGALIGDFYVTMQSMVGGLLLGTLAGIATGLILGRNEFLAAVLNPYIGALYSLPRIALAPLFVLWLGIGLASKIVLTSTVVFFVTFGSTFSGVKSVDNDLVDVVRLMGARRAQIFSTVVLPSALPFIFVGLRIAVPYSLVGAVVAEYIAAVRGLGHVINRAAGAFDTTGVMAGLTVLMVIGLVLSQSLNYLETRSTRWKA